MTRIHIANLSGGQDSTAMVVRMLELGERLDYIVFCNTGVEFDAMYEYLNKLNNYLKWKFNREITFLDGDTYYDVTKRIKTEKSKYAGKPKGVTMSVGMDECTRDLKIKRAEVFARKAANKGEIVFYVGYTFREVLNGRKITSEKKKITYDYPLYRWEWNEPQVQSYLKEKTIYNPLYNHFTRTGCFCCPKQSEKDWFNLWKHYNHHFEQAKKIEEWCEANNAIQKYFRYTEKEGSIPLRVLEQRFILKDKQTTFDLDENQEQISCMCK